jgi:hypothetical protein
MAARQLEACPEIDDEIRESSTRLAASCKPRRARAKTISEAPWEKARRQARDMMASGDWSDAIPRHFVAAYELLHEKVYGVAPAELNSKTRVQASYVAAACLSKQFGGDVAEMAAFMRWSWEREMSREKWRREQGRQGGRLGVSLQFGAVVTDYRLAMARSKGAP